MTQFDEEALRIARSDLSLAKNKIFLQNLEKEKSESELLLAQNEILVQKGEKKARATELEVVNKELIFQNEEKNKRSAELVIANKALLFENKEKETRAAEFAITFKALERAKNDNVFLNDELVERTTELEIANKELESFAYSVSHDLRSPLRAINGFSQVLLEDCSSQMDQDAKSLLNEIIWNAKRMGELIDNLLEFSRVSRKQISVAEVDMGRLVASVVQELNQIQPQKKAKVIINELPNIKADSNMLRQVLINLISNAYKYSGKKAQAVIEIGCLETKDLCTYYVKDNGVGFDMKYYNNLFGVFQRLHSSEDFEGSGIGLSIVDRIISKHKGKVWAKAAVNKGACFYFSLPTE